jgi:lipoprotein-releasing system ATP-binding protein
MLVNDSMVRVLTTEPDSQKIRIEDALRVVDLRKSFESPTKQRIEVLRGVTFDVRPGEVIAIIGASGSGKSTLLQLLGGLDEPDHGSVVLTGTDLTAMRGDVIATFRQLHIGFVFQFHYLLNDLSAVENVALPLMISRIAFGDARRKAIELLKEVGLADRSEHPTSHLSGGEQQRVALARALVTAPRLLLADEPTGNLDTAIGDEIGKIIVNYVSHTTSIAIIATHNENLAGICDRVMLLEDGRIRPV